MEASCRPGMSCRPGEPGSMCRSVFIKEIQQKYKISMQTRARVRTETGSIHTMWSRQTRNVHPKTHINQGRTSIAHNHRNIRLGNSKHTQKLVLCKVAHKLRVNLKSLWSEWMRCLDAPTPDQENVDHALMVHVFRRIGVLTWVCVLSVVGHDVRVCELLVFEVG